MEYFNRGMIYGYSLGDCIGNNAFDGITATDSHFEYKLDKKEFLVNVSIKKDSHQHAVDLISDLQKTLKLYTSRQNGKLLQKIVENTKFRAENDQVFVITRLPRGSLASLFTVDAK